MRRKSNLQNEGGNYSSAQHWRVTINDMSTFGEIALKETWEKVTVQIGATLMIKGSEI